MMPLDRTGTHASAYDYEPANIRPSRWRFAVIAGLAVIVLGVMAMAARAADVFLLVNDLPKHRYADPGQTACTTDLQGEAIVQPKGTVLRCEPVREVVNAAR